jgi:hypothetical protein
MATEVRGPLNVSVRFIQGALLVAAAGAVLMLLGVLGATVNLIGLAALLLGTVLTAPAGRLPGNGWWSLLAAGAALALIGALLSLATDAVGGLVGLLGGVAVLAGAAFGFPD